MFKISTHLVWIQLYCASMCESHEYILLSTQHCYKKKSFRWHMWKSWEAFLLLAMPCGLHTRQPSALEPTIPKFKKKAFHWHNIYLSNLSSSIERCPWSDSNWEPSKPVWPKLVLGSEIGRQLWTIKR
jgi:hypothetical protein